MRIFTLPDLGEGLQDAEVVEWHAVPGAEIAADAPMVSVETDKAIVEIPAPFAGRIEKIFAGPGDRVRVGAPLVGFEGQVNDTGTVVGDLAPKAQRAERAAAGDVPKAPKQTKAGTSATATTQAPTATRRVVATPAVRALAQSLGVDLATLQGTGPGGSVSTADVLRVHSGSAGAGAGTALARSLAEAEDATVGLEGDGDPLRRQITEDLRGLRRSMAQHMTTAHAEVAAVTIFDDADVDAWPGHAPVLARLLRAIVVASHAEPSLNAWFDGRRLARRTFDEIHIGIAVDTPDGLLVPVLRDANRLDETALARDARRLIDAARARTLAVDELRGATISLSNFGTIAGRYATPIVVPPAVAIVGAGRLAPQPVALDDGTVLARRVLPLSLTFDHRAVTGGEAARFLQALIEDLSRAE